MTTPPWWWESLGILLLFTYNNQTVKCSLLYSMVNCVLRGFTESFTPILHFVSFKLYVVVSCAYLTGYDLTISWQLSIGRLFTFLDSGGSTFRGPDA